MTMIVNELLQLGVCGVGIDGKFAYAFVVVMEQFLKC
jgi:hypothetical protein